MKKFFLFVFAIISFSSCDKGPMYPQAPSLSATINNVNWSSTSTVLNQSGSQYEIKAPNPYGGNFMINMPSNIIPGTYSFSQTGPYLGIYTNDLNGNVNKFYSVSGTLTIALSPPGKLQGMFNFTAANILDDTDKVYITNGVFSVNSIQ